MQSNPCRQCGKPVPPGHRFCGYCGGKAEDVKPKVKGSGAPETMVFDASPVKRKARLVLLRGSGGDGASYYLNSTEHVCGRSQGTILFPDDPSVSPRQCNFVYRNGHLYVIDEGSANGTYIRLRGRIPLTDGDRFVCGEQMFDFRLFPETIGEQLVGDTTFSGTPMLWPWRYQLCQVLTRGRSGEVRCVESGDITVGREDCDLNFPHDRFMSHQHSRVVCAEGGQCFLEDAGSKNGTYYRIRDEVGLQNGDYLFLGKQLVRVEIT